MKRLFLCEKPSVARTFAEVLGVNPSSRQNGYIEDDNTVITWCVGHLVEMSYPEKYDPSLKNWSLDALPFIPTQYLYEVKEETKNQFNVVHSLFLRNDISEIYFAGDSAREGELIGRYIRQMGVNPNVTEKRIWINSQTEEEILRGIKEAKPLSYYDNLAASAYIRAEEDYLFGINFSRLLTLKFQKEVKENLGLSYTDKCPISVGRVMTCVLGMIVNRENEIKNFKKTSYYGIKGLINEDISLEWKAIDTSQFVNSPLLYKENGFIQKENAKALITNLTTIGSMKIEKISLTPEKKSAPLLFNLAELQNECTKRFKYSPAKTLEIVQKLYEGKLVTYPRTDAKVLSSAICPMIIDNIKGLSNVYVTLKPEVDAILANHQDKIKTIASSRYCNDSKISDHYAIIPTGKGYSSILDNEELLNVYDLIARRFLSIFASQSEYIKCEVTGKIYTEPFTLSLSGLKEPGYLKIAGYDDKKEDKIQEINKITQTLQENASYPCTLELHAMETKPPSRYNSGSMILAMENAGRLIEDDELREQIKDCGIGTSATRAAILEKLIKDHYIDQNNKTQTLTPTDMGVEIVRVVKNTLPNLLLPELTAGWEQGLTAVANGEASAQDYYNNMVTYIQKETIRVKETEFENNSEIVIGEKTPVDLLKAGKLTCPLCKKGVVRVTEKSKGYFCSEFTNGCKLSIPKVLCGRKTKESDVATLCTKGITAKLKGFHSSKKDTDFSAKLMLKKDGSVTLLFN